MIQITKPNKIIYNIPPKILLNKKLLSILIKELKLYKEHQITLKTLIKTVSNLNQSNASINLKEVMEEIISFSFVDRVLIDILNELMENEKYS